MHFQNIICVIFCVIYTTHVKFLAYAAPSPLHPSAHDTLQLASRTPEPARPTILVSFQNPGPKGTKEDEGVTKTIESLFEDASTETKGVIPLVEVTFKNHLETGRRTIALIPFSFTGLDICRGECTASADVFHKVSWIRDSKGKVIYAQ
ncbi:hypothetical protein F5878DRAFT_616425 [Lentinula raphanica]|uniref:Uncharacterized protein n=1 Tax=Lentinula raphanica TaxID=153919 RepID=A0AA38UF47_9AGAR|nr:hypothetical protein F5878DRAFT_616425 [Lentinula raphanica]